MERVKRVAATTALTALTMCTLASTAYAQQGAERAGKNIGDIISAIGGYVLFGIAGLIAIGLIVSRKFTAIGGLLIMVFIVGGLFLAPGEIGDLIRSTWRQIGRGV